MFREGRVFDAANIDSVIGDFTLVNIIEPVDKVGYRRFAGTGGADKRDLLSALCIEGNIIQNVHLAVIAEGYVVQLNHARKRNFSHGIVCSRLGSVGNAPDFFAVCVQAEVTSPSSISGGTSISLNTRPRPQAQAERN